MFLRVCKYDCKSPCEECNNECKNYAIVLKCIMEKVFECNFIENAIPTIFSCEKTNNLLLISLSDIVNTCYYLGVDKNTYAINVINNTKFTN